MYESFAPAYGGFYSDGFNGDRELARDAEAAGMQTHAYVDVLPQLLNLTRIETGNITVRRSPLPSTARDIPHPPLCLILIRTTPLQSSCRFSHPRRHPYPSPPVASV